VLDSFFGLNDLEKPMPRTDATSPTSHAAQRSHPRVRANFMVKLQVNERTVLAKARDLSMAGLYLFGNVDGVGQTVGIRIPFPNDREVVAACQVKRRGPDGIGLSFASVEWDDLFALARFLYPRLP
jgi:hypothetical protein